MKQVCSVIVSFLLSLSLDALKSPCPWEAGVKRPKATWEREMGHVFICARGPPGWNPVFSGRCVHARTVVCNISIFFSLCLDVSVVAVSVIHGEQLHISLREKPTHENVGENDVKESA